MGKIQEIQKLRIAAVDDSLAMTRVSLILLLSLIILPSANAQVEKLKIGMGHAEFNSVMENLIPGKNNYNGYIKENRTIQNLLFEMHGEIKNDTLRDMWAASTSTVDFEDDAAAERTKKSLENFLSVTKYLNGSFTRTYGESKPVIDQTQNYLLTKDSKSDTIFKCTWQDKDKTIVLAFLYKSSKMEQNPFQFENRINANVDMARSNLRIFMSMKGKESKENLFGLACGMNAATVYKENKALMPKGYLTTGTWYKKVNLYGVEDDWRFDFESGKLTGYNFDSELYDSDMYSEENTLTESKFNKYSMSVKSLLVEYKKTYGTPVSSVRGPATLKEARIKAEAEMEEKTYGTAEIIISKTNWKTESATIEVSLMYVYRSSKDIRKALEYKVEVK